ncbi:MAG: N-acetylmuramoyl-L-alanine amidase [Bacteroidales bacterium]|nr:N-acetylmuramoyl-L-alanine amidase [Bacteroidales bacterium]
MIPLLPIIDAGHGGMVRGANGRVKYDTAPKKMFDHGKNGVAYEGAINRLVAEKLVNLWLGRQYRPLAMIKTNLDLSLTQRVHFANGIYNAYKDRYCCLYLSLHANAGGGTGFEVYTTPNDNVSDKYATIIAEELKKEVPNFNFRQDNSDGDLDKEALFYVLAKTEMPAVLAELLFFDNPTDWQYMKTDAYVTDMANALYNALIRAENEVKP